MNTNDSANLGTLFGEAADDGLISASSGQLLLENLSGNVVAGAAGKAADEVDVADVTLVTGVFDDSGSIRFAGLAEAVRDGQNGLVQALKGARDSREVLLAQWKLGHTAELVHSYLPLDETTLFDRHNYDPRSGTALYDVWMDALASNVAYAQTLAASGTQVTSVAVLVTDGHDEHSTKYRAAACAKLADDLLRSEQFVLAFIGVGEEREFRTIAADMGFPADSVLVSAASTSELRRALALASQSIVQVSRGLIQPGTGRGFFGP